MVVKRYVPAKQDRGKRAGGDAAWACNASQVLVDIQAELKDPTWAQSRKATAESAKTLIGTLPEGDVSKIPYYVYDKVGWLTEQFQSNWAAVVSERLPRQPAQHPSLPAALRSCLSFCRSAACS